MIHSNGRNRNGRDHFSVFDGLANKLSKKSQQTSLRNDIPDQAFSEHAPEMKNEIKDARLKRFANDSALRKNQLKNRDWVKGPEAQIVRADNSEMVGRGAKIISQAGAKDVKNDISSTKVLGGLHQPSIWNPDVIKEQVQAPSNDEKTAVEKQNIASLRNGIKQERLNDMVKAVQHTDTRKACGVQQTGEFRGSGSYQPPKQGMSIFDFAGNFERVPNQTEGEKVAELSRKPKPRDNSWRGVQNQRARTSSSLDKLFDSLMQERK
jgi:hypothetical protein